MTRRTTILLMMSAAGLLGGCGQPYMSAERQNRGLVMVLTGIEGRSPFNEGICRALNDGGVNWGIELVDWTVGLPGGFLVNLRGEARNRRKAEDLADRIVRYQMAYPGRPVMLVGQSGGGAMAVWTAEALPATAQADGVILLAAALSPEYRLDRALERSRLGIVNFHSSRDWVFLGAGTTVYGTMDGKHTDSAGRVGFTVPQRIAETWMYERLYQVAWTRKMSEAGNIGGHLTSGAHEFVSRYVAPLVLENRWSSVRIDVIISGELDHWPGDPYGGR